MTDPTSLRARLEAAGVTHLLADFLSEADVAEYDFMAGWRMHYCVKGKDMVAFELAEGLSEGVAKIIRDGFNALPGLLDEREALIAEVAAQNDTIERAATNMSRLRELLLASQAREAALREALATIFAKLDRGEGAPGHSHDIPGIWDSDNAPGVAGTKCEWCAQWEAARTALGAPDHG